MHGREVWIRASHPQTDCNLHYDDLQNYRKAEGPGWSNSGPILVQLVFIRMAEIAGVLHAVQVVHAFVTSHYAREVVYNRMTYV